MPAWNDSLGTTPRRFLGVAVFVLASAGVLAWLLVASFPAARSQPRLPVLPPAFVISTALLAAVSVLSERAVWAVRRERQRPFRKALAWALVAGTAFTSLQAWGLSGLRLSEDAGDEGAGVNAMLFLFAILHAVHVTVGLLFLVLVNVRARADRYDHEYFWGVRLCGLYWHALGVLWIVILGAFCLAAGFLYG